MSPIGCHRHHERRVAQCFPPRSMDGSMGSLFGDGLKQDRLAAVIGLDEGAVQGHGSRLAAR